jgi:predicted nucleic acid-binding Zn ribbon protein
LNRVKINPEDRGPVNLADVLGPLFAARGWGRKTERVKLETVWAEVVGPVTAAETRVMRLQRGVLEVEVRQSILLQELAQFQKRTILTALREKHPNPPITDIKFRAGVW